MLFVSMYRVLACLFLLSYLFGRLSVASAQTMDPTPYTFRENTTDYVRQGAFFFNQHQDRQAIDAYTKALRVNPASALSGIVYNNLGVAYSNVGWYDLAIVSFQRALRLQPQFMPYAERLIDTYHRSGRLAAAEQSLLNVVETNPLDAEAWFLLGMLYQKNNDFVLAFEAFSKVQELEPATLWAKAARNKLAALREETNQIPDNALNQVK
jgi:tetratricopeptide (TPR) repeat protein